MQKRRIESKRSPRALIAATALLITIVLSSCDLLGEILGEDGDGDTTVFAEDALGRGYNMLGSYADNKEVRAQVLDFQRLLDDGLIDERVIERSSFETFSGSTVEEFTESMEVKVEVSGEYKGFSGSLETNFSSETYSRAEFSYATVQSEIFKRSFNVDTRSTATLRDYLTERAREELNDPSVSADAILSRYGSHVLVGIYVGGRMDYNMAADYSQFSSEQLIGVAANASFKNAFASAEIDTQVNYGSEIQTIESNSSIRVNVYGGSSEFGQNILTDNDYTRWIESVDGRQIFVGFLNGQQPLVPIWEFVDDTGRADAIEAAFVTIAGDTSENFTEQPMRVEVKLERFTAVNIDDEVGGSNDVEVFGRVFAQGWERVDNRVSPPRLSGSNTSVNLWSVGRGSALTIREGDGQDDGRVPSNATRTVEINNFDEQNSAIILGTDLTERDDGAFQVDDPLDDAREIIYLRNGFSGERVLRAANPKTEGEEVKVYISLSIVR